MIISKKCIAFVISFDEFFFSFCMILDEKLRTCVCECVNAGKSCDAMSFNWENSAAQRRELLYARVYTVDITLSFVSRHPLLKPPPQHFTALTQPPHSTSFSTNQCAHFPCALIFSSPREEYLMHLHSQFTYTIYIEC